MPSPDKATDKAADKKKKIVATDLQRFEIISLLRKVLVFVHKNPDPKLAMVAYRGVMFDGVLGWNDGIVASQLNAKNEDNPRWPPLNHNHVARIRSTSFGHIREENAEVEEPTAPAFDEMVVIARLNAEIATRTADLMKLIRHLEQRAEQSERVWRFLFGSHGLSPDDMVKWETSERDAAKKRNEAALRAQQALGNSTM